MYDAFISYSHAADGKLAPALQRALEKYAKPWYRRRALHIFRDETNLSANPHLWQSIIDNLSQAEWFLLMASPQAAESEWVRKEIQWWLANRSPDRLLILVTEGEVKWKGKAGDFDWAGTTAIPGILQGELSDEPLYVDLRSARSGPKLTLRHTEFRAAVLRIAAPIHGLPMDEMDGEAARTYKKNVASAAALVVGLIVALVTATWQWRAATLAEKEAVKQANMAQSRELASYAGSVLANDAQLALNLAVRGALKWKTAEVETVLRRALASVNPGPTVQVAHVGDAEDRLAALSPRANYGVTQRSDGHFAIWRLLPKPSRISSNWADGDSPLLSQDETVFATRTLGGVLTVWSIVDGQQIASFDKVQMAAFTGSGLTMLRADAMNESSLTLWDPETRQRTWESVKAPRGVLAATFLKHAQALYATVDAHHVDVWNVYASFSDINGPQSRYTAPQEITGAWFDESGYFVLATNVYDSGILESAAAHLVSHLSVGSLRSAVFSHDGEFLVAVPKSGQPAVVSVRTGDVLSRLPEKSPVAAAAFRDDDQTIVVAFREGAIRNYSCSACLPFERLLRAAQDALIRPLTLAQRELYLHEQRPHPCPISMTPRAGSCLELAPDSGPPGTVVEVSIRGFVGTISLSLTDAKGTHWELPSFEKGPLDELNPERVGTLTIPEGVSRGQATISAFGSGSATRTFAVTSLWATP